MPALRAGHHTKDVKGKGNTMTKSELISKMTRELRELPEEAVHQAVEVIIVQLSDAIASGQGVEIRGFSSFSLRYPCGQNTHVASRQ